MLWPDRPTCHDQPDSPFRFGTPFWRPPEPDYRRRCDCGYEQIGPYGYPFRTCSYCGSIHPADLLALLEQPTDPVAMAVCRRCQAAARTEPTPPLSAGDAAFREWQDWMLAGTLPHTCHVTLGGSDWKYGWPHKFYVHGIPNPYAGEGVDGAWSTRGVDSLEGLDLAPHEVAVPDTHRPGRFVIHTHERTGAPPTTTAEFYNDHLTDAGYDDEALRLILAAVSEAGGITFERVERDGRPVLRYSAPYRGYQKD